MSLADKFNLFNEFNILRITCAVFFIPHIIGKITVPATLDFFVKAGFRPPATWMYIAGTIETILCIGLFFGIYLQYVGVHRFHPLAGRGRCHLQSHQVLDLGYRRRRILHLFGQSAALSSPCTPIMPASEFSALKGSPNNG